MQVYNCYSTYSINETNKPDLSIIKSASKMIGKYLSKESVVIYESTVYPGLTEDVCIPILEKESGLSFGKDFTVGYSLKDQVLEIQIIH